MLALVPQQRPAQPKDGDRGEEEPALEEEEIAAAPALALPHL